MLQITYIPYATLYCIIYCIYVKGFGIMALFESSAHITTDIQAREDLCEMKREQHTRH